MQQLTYPVPAMPTLPTIIVDTREQAPLPFTRLESIRGTLYSGDYSARGFEGVFAIERKSLDDLAGCCIASERERFGNELHRLRGYRFKRLLIIGTAADIEAGSYRSRIVPAAIFGTLAAIEARYDVPVVFAADPAEGGRMVETWAAYYAREAWKSLP